MTTPHLQTLLKRLCIALPAAWMPLIVAAQGGEIDPTGALGTPSALDKAIGLLTSYGLYIVFAIVGGGALLMIGAMVSRRSHQSADDLAMDMGDMRNSRFEQLYAEIQGLSLRVKSGESKGYYRKIEQLVRVFLERTGHAGARKMEDDAIRQICAKGQLPKEQADALLTIFNRCKQGAEHESDKLDFTAAELLRNLYSIVDGTDRATAKP